MSNNERHTPSPWRWNDTYAARAGDQTMSLIGDDGHGILSCDGMENSPHRTADAALIAAAPELLEALKEIERASTWCMHIECMEPIGRLTDIARAAIARAEGREP